MSEIKFEGYIKISISDNDIRDIGENMEDKEYEDFLKDLDNGKISLKEILSMCMMYGDVEESDK